MSRYRSSRLRPPASDTPIDDALRRAPRPAVTPRVAIGAALLAGGIAVGCSDGPLSSAKDEAFAPGVRFDLAALPIQPGVPPVCDEADLVSLTVTRGATVVIDEIHRNKEDAVQGPGIPSSASCVHNFPLELGEAGRYTFSARVSGAGRSLAVGTIPSNVEDGFLVEVPLLAQPALDISTEADLPAGRLGGEPPQSYGFRIDDASPAGPIGLNETKTINALAARQRAVELTGFAPCDAIAEGLETIQARGVDVVSAAQAVPSDPPGGLTGPGAQILPRVAFDIRCYGDLRVVAITTTGTPPGPDGYDVRLRKRTQLLHSDKVGHPRDSVAIPNVFATNPDDSTDVYVVSLDAASPCTASPASQDTRIRPDSLSRVVFTLVCTTVPPLTPKLAAPSSLSFTEVKIGESCAQPVTIGNTGTAELTVSAISISGVGFSFTAPSTPFTIPPGASQTVIVSFSPPGPGVFNGSLTVTSNDPDTPLHTVNLFGRQGGTTACP